EPSETFIRTQGEAMRRVTPFYVGSRIVPGIALPKERTIVINTGGLSGTVQEAIFKLWGVSPLLKRRLRHLNPLVLHAHYGPNGLRVLPLARAINRPLVVTFHGGDATVTNAHAKNSYYGHRQFEAHKQVLQREATLFIAVSQFIKSKLIDQGFPRYKIVVHYIGVDLQLFKPRKAPQRLPIVLFVGRLVEKKGCDYLIRAMSDVQAALAQVELIVVGDGPARGELESLAAHTLQRYRFVGVQSPESVRTYMNMASLLAVPSVTAHSGDSEGLPTVILEAMALGLPVIGTISAGIPEAITDGQSGFLVKERDSKRMAERTMTLLSNPELWGLFSRAGRLRVEQDFDVL